jgi:hypothetical protein
MVWLATSSTTPTPTPIGAGADQVLAVAEGGTGDFLSGWARAGGGGRDLTPRIVGPHGVKRRHALRVICVKPALARPRITDGKRGAARHPRSMPGRTFKVGRIAGIPVGISPWWLVIVALFTWSLGSSYFPAEVKGISSLASYGLGLASVLLLFASILAHEFGHVLVARRRGVEVDEIDLWLLGGRLKNARPANDSRR